MFGEWCYICYHCGYFSVDFIVLKRHIKREHLKSSYLHSLTSIHIKGKQCSKNELETFSSPKKRVSYKSMKYKGMKCTYCDYCPQSNTSIQVANANLKRHIKEIHTEVQKYLCKECDYKSVRKTELGFHVMAKHQPKELLPFICAICSFRTYKKANLRCHLFCKHFTGTKCSRHKRSKKTNEQRMIIECGLCDYKTHDNHNYKSHFLYCHSQDKPIICPYCNHRAKKTSDINSHISSVHTKVKKYLCPHCNYGSNKSSHLASHVRRRHTKVRPYPCAFCSYAGFTTGDVKIHIVKKHIRKPTTPKKSTICGKSANTEIKIEIKEEQFSV